MEGSSGLLKLGVIGLGRLWEMRHKPALTNLTDQFRVTVVYDQVSRRAELEAKQRRSCTAVSSLRALTSHRDVDAILYTGGQWFGAYPLSLALAANKPIYCAWNVGLDPQGFLDAMSSVNQETCSPVFWELARRKYPATIKLRELLANELGRPQWIIGVNRNFGFDRQAQPGPNVQMTPTSLAADPGLYILDWLSHLQNAQPTAITALSTGTPQDSEWLSLTVEFAEGVVGQISITGHPWIRQELVNQTLASSGLEICAKSGMAWVELPNRLTWATHDQSAPPQVFESDETHLGKDLLRSFYQRIYDDTLKTEHPNLQDAITLAKLSLALQRSLRDRRRVELNEVNS